MSRSFVALLVLLAVSGIAFSVDVTSCQVINSPGNYILTQDIVSGTPQSYGVFGSVCIGINVSDVVLDCDGYTVDAGTSSMTDGILAAESTFGPTLDNVTIANCTVTGNFSTGIEVRDVQNGLVRNNIVEDLTPDGFVKGFELRDNNQGTITENNTARRIPGRGFLLGSTNGFNTLLDDLAYDNTGPGFEFSTGQRNHLERCTAYNNSDGYYIGGESDHNVFVESVAYDNLDDGFEIHGYNSTFIRTRAYNNADHGYEVDGFYITDPFIIMSDSNATYNGNDGLYMEWVYNSSVDPSYFCNNVRNGITLNYTSNVTISDSVACNNGDSGIFLLNSSTNDLIDNTAYLNGDNGIRLYSGSMLNRLTGNTAYSNGYNSTLEKDGIFLGLDSNDNILTGNEAYNNTNTGISVTTSTGNTLVGNNAHDQVLFYGIYLNMAPGNNLTGNTAHDNPGSGFRAVSGSDNNIFVDNTAYGNTIGFDIFQVDGSSLTGNTANSNSVAGASVNGGDTLVSWLHLFDNPVDLSVGGNSFTLNMSEVLFDNPAGDFQDYTNLSLNDSVPGGGGSYDMAWTTQPAPMPSMHHKSFANKFVDITNSTPVVIESVVWSWLDSEPGAGNEDDFDIWRHDGSWSDMNAALDTGDNTLTLTDLDTFSVFAILYNNTECPLPFTSPGTYTMMMDLEGATNDISSEYFIGPAPRLACVKIASSDVVFDCNGYSITDNGTASLGTSIGVFVNGTRSNVTLMNCPGISEYDNGVTTYDVSDSLFTDLVLFTNDQYGADFVISDSVLASIESYNNAGDGIRVSGDYNNMTGLMLHDNLYSGLDLENGDYGIIENSTFYNNFIGLFFNEAIYNFVRNNTAYDNEYGFYLFNEDYNNVLINNSAYNNGDTGFLSSFLDDDSSFIDNLAFGNGYAGFSISYSSNLALSGNTINDNTEYGIIVNGADNLTSSSDHLYLNGVDFLVRGDGAIINVTLESDIFDSNGSFVNYTNLSVTDTLAGADEYSIDWDSEPAPVLTGRSFAGKFVNIANLSGPLSIDNVVWHWLDSELVSGSYLENYFYLLRYDSAWGNFNSAPDTAANTFSGIPVDVFGIFGIYEITGSPDDDDGGGGAADTFSVMLETSCDNNTVKVTDSGSPVEDAQIIVDDAFTLAPVDSGTTDSHGEFTFSGCGMTVKILAKKSGYSSETIVKDLVDCAVCAVECVVDEDCPEGQICIDNMCVLPPPECTVDADCAEGETCSDGSCQEREPGFECTSDDDCSATHYCDIEIGAAGGFCREVTGQCGMPVDHEWVKYECGDEIGCPSCPEDYVCVDHECEPERDLEGPSSAYVGDRAPITATEGDGACKNCEIRIKLPNGEILSGRTDSDGKLELPLQLQGTYELTLLKDGEPVKTIMVESLARPSLPEEEQPTQVLDDLVSLLFLLILLGLLVVGVMYWRRRTMKK